MRAHVGALVALDALGLVPVGNDHGDAALLVCGGAQLKLAVGAIDEGGNRQAVAVHAIDGLEQVLDLLGDSGLGLLGELDGSGILGGSQSAGTSNLRKAVAPASMALWLASTIAWPFFM